MKDTPSESSLKTATEKTSVKVWLKGNDLSIWFIHDHHVMHNPCSDDVSVDGSIRIDKPEKDLASHDRENKSKIYIIVNL
jgi:hypothetical protein